MTLEKGILMGVTILATGAMILQCRKPQWGLGRLYAAVMNRSHGALTAWGLEHVAIEKGYRILDMGCGGGRTIGRLAAMATEGKVYGADYSADSVAVARRTTAESIAAEASRSFRAPSPAYRLRRVCSTSSRRWRRTTTGPSRSATFKELRRVLKPGGRLVIIPEAYRRRKVDVVALIMKVLGGSCLSVREHEELIAAAG